MRNFFNVVRSIGLIFFGVGTAFVGTTAPEFLDRVTRQNTFYNDDLYLVTGMMILGFGYLILGVAGLLKSKWFPTGGIVWLIISFIFFNGILIIEIVPNISSRMDDLLAAGALIMIIYVLVFSLIILMRNEYFLEALNSEDRNKEEDDRILDA